MTTRKTSGAKTAPATLAFASADLADYGHGLVVLAREAGAKTETATFTVDTLATGVRRANRAAVPAAAFTTKALPHLKAEHGVVPVPSSVALAILEGAVAFAKKAGFAAPENLAESLALASGIEAAPAPFAFGKDGKPHFRPMPGDREEFVESALARLRKACGPSGFTYDLEELDEDHLDGDDDAPGGEGDDE